MELESEEICIDVNGVEINAEIEFFYTEGWEGNLEEPSYDEEFELVNLFLLVDKIQTYSISRLLKIPEIEQSIIASIKEIWEDEKRDAALSKAGY